MLGFSDLVSVIKFISEEIADWNSLKRERIEKTFETVVESSYRDLELIHHDYSTQLSLLRDHLINKSLPPHDLIQWLRQTGLEYRHKREALLTIEAEVWRFSGKSINPNKDLKSRFNWHLQLYVKSVLDYLTCTISYTEISFYRDYEDRLDSLLKMMEVDYQIKGISADSKTFAHLFYETDYVKDMNKILIRVCDLTLPKRWKEVNVQYRVLRSIVHDL